MVAKQERPVSLPSITQRIQTGHATMYVTVTHLDDKPFEVFIQIGHANPCESAWLEALGRAISTGLRYGVPAEEFIEQFIGIECVPAPDPDRQGFVKSPADGVAKVLADVLVILKEARKVANEE